MENGQICHFFPSQNFHFIFSLNKNCGPSTQLLLLNRISALARPKTALQVISEFVLASGTWYKFGRIWLKIWEHISPLRHDNVVPYFYPVSIYMHLPPFQWRGVAQSNFMASIFPRVRIFSGQSQCRQQSNKQHNLTFLSNNFLGLCNNFSFNSRLLYLD